MAEFSAEELPIRFDFAAAQQTLYAAWEAAGLFHAQPPAAGQSDPTRGPFCIVIPPPNVTGALHLGHALNNTLQDIQIRLRRMQGFNTLWVPGTDHAGIATQAVVEKRLREEEGKTRHDLGREALVQRIWQWKDQYEARILSQLKRLGCSCDWQRTRFTLDPVCARAVRETFFDLFRQGLIYRGKRLVNWDTFLQTAVSDDEVFHETIQGHFWYFRYPVIDPQPGEPAYVVVATTRPETMLGDTAVAVHPDPGQALDEAEAELRQRLEKAPAKEQPALRAQLEDLARRRVELLPRLVLLRDMARAGRQVRLPLAERPIPLICDTWARPELGTGCVKITPAHDPNDYEVWQRHPSIGAINILQPDGRLNEEAGPYRGLTIAQARQRVVADMEARGLLESVEEREIDLAHSDRSKTPIEPYLADQWFVKMGDHADGRPGLAQLAMDAVTSGQVRIIPPRYAKSYLDWLAEKRDWPVSRQLWWGHRIPIWSRHFASAEEYRGCGMRTAEAARQDALSDRLWALEENEGSVCTRFVPDADPSQFLPLHPPAQGGFTVYVCVRDERPGGDGESVVALLEQCGFTQSDEVLDTWFSSALWPHSTLGWPEATPELAYWYPTSVLITSRDIITLWVARMVLMGLNNTRSDREQPVGPENLGQVPFYQVFIHPKILDGYGETMSKSKGNGVDPIDIIDKFGADALRWGLTALTTETQDVRMPVQFECPHCQALIDQTRNNRELPRIECPKCGRPFGTQWARTPEDQALARAAVVSERFEVARNFMNKLWNAARLVLVQLRGFEPGALDEAALTLEDRWLLSRLETVTAEATAALTEYRYADAAKVLYDFAWDEFCSLYLEIAKARLADPARRCAAQHLMAHALDRLLRLLHPIMPFLTEAVWQRLNQVAPQRGLKPQQAPRWLMTAPWPQPDRRWQDASIEATFAVFQQVLTAVREIRSRQNIASRQRIQFVVRCEAATVGSLAPMADYFASMAHAELVGLGPEVPVPPTHAKTSLPGLEIFVDMKDFIDVAAELAKNRQQQQKLRALIEAKQAKLQNENFLARAPAAVVQQERDSLAQLQQQLAGVEAALAALQGHTHQA
jgi:valyl-tRNA synthetase